MYPSLTTVSLFLVMFISDNESFNPSLWEEQRKQRAQVAFECDEDKDEREAPPRVSIEFIFNTWGFAPSSPSTPGSHPFPYSGCGFHSAEEIKSSVVSLRVSNRMKYFLTDMPVV